MEQKTIDEHNTLCEQRKQECDSGQWTSEPNRVNWKHAGLDCMLVRHARFMNWRGYVGVPEGHPAFGKGYDDVEASVHGGLTYANECAGYICHIPAAGDQDRVWWLGFDCAHAGDLSPGMHQFPEIDALAKLSPYYVADTYRDMSYVQAECNQLAEQLAEMSHE